MLNILLVLSRPYGILYLVAVIYILYKSSSSLACFPFAATCCILLTVVCVTGVRLLTSCCRLFAIHEEPAPMPPVVTVLANALPPAITVPVDAVMLPAKAAPVAIPCTCTYQSSGRSTNLNIIPYITATLCSNYSTITAPLRRAYGRGDSKKRQVACLIR